MCRKIAAWHRLLVRLPLLIVLWFLAIPSAHADGGAPNLAYIAGTSDGISVVDVLQQKVTRTIPTATEPYTILLSPDARFLFVTQPRAESVSVLSARTGETNCTAHIPGSPSLLALDNNVNVIYTAGNGAAQVRELDLTTCAIKRTLQAPGPVYGLAITTINGVHTESRLWVASRVALTVFDGMSGQQLENISVPAGPRYLTIPQGQSTTAYFSTQQGSVEAINMTSFHITPLITGGVYGPMDYNAITGEIYVPDQRYNQIVVLAPLNAGTIVPHEPVRTISFSSPPISVAITNDGQLGFVALAGGKMTLLDLPGRQVIVTVTVGGHPHFIVAGEYPPTLGTTPESATFLHTTFTILAYVLMIALFLIPILLFWRYNKAKLIVH